MRDLVVDGPTPDRVLLGRLGLDGFAPRVKALLGMRDALPPLAARPCQGVLVIGATRSGKTTSLLIPAVSEWDGPVVTTSIRSDVLAESIQRRREIGWPVLIYNPSGQGKYGSNTWSPLIAAMGDKPWSGARRIASALISAAGLAERGANADEKFWNAAAADYLGPLMLAAAQTGPSMEPVMRWLHEGGKTEGIVVGGGVKREVRARLSQYPEARRVVEGVWELDARQRDSIYITARTALSAYEDEDVFATCLAGKDGEQPDITPDSVLGITGEDGREPAVGATLYIVSPETNLRYFAPLFTAMLTSLIDAAYTRAGGGTLDPPLLLALDEVANIAPLEDLPSWSSTSVGTRIQLITVVQDLGQAEGIWGEDGTRTLLTNHDVLLFPGTKDRKTLEWAQAVLGEVEVERWIETRTSGGRTRTQQIERRPLMSTSEIRQMPMGTALLISGHRKPAILALRQWKTI